MDETAELSESRKQSVAGDAGNSTAMAPVVQQLRSLQAFKRVRELMHELKLPPGRASWDEMNAVLKDNWSLTVERRLRVLYEELRLCGRKHVFLYKPPPGLAKLIPRLRALQVDAVPNTSYPFPPLNEDVTDVPRLAQVQTHGDKLLLVFTSYRIFRKETPFDPVWLSKDAPPDLKTASFRVVQEIAEYAFDVIAIPLNAGYLEIRIDLFNHATTPTPSEALQKIQKEIRQRLNLADSAEFFNKPINLVPVMLPLYENPKEGRIVELEFLCSTSARRAEKLTAKGTDDLRTEVYHKNGMAALQSPIQIFREAVEWSHDEKSNPMEDAALILSGIMTTKGEVRPLYEATIPRMVNRPEYEFILRRLISYAQ